MVTIKDGCGCDPCDCDWKQKLKEAYARASVSVNKVGDFDGAIYYPDGSGFVKIPIPRLSEVQQITTNKEDIAELKAQDVQLQANITAEENARKTKDDNLDSDIARIDATDTRQSELIQDNADRITSTYNDLVSTEATVATHDSEIITLKANNQALAKSLVSDVLMTDGTTAGSVQVSIEREDGALITSANYRWGKDIGIRLEAGTQAGYVKAVISLSDGTELVSNEYKIVEVLESDVYVTAITLIADQAAGTLGGNISYSNGTTQTINSVSVPTAPGVTSAIETLQTRMTAVEQKNTQQDSSISALDSRVKAIEDTPGVGQFGAGKLGTIAGSTTDGRIKAEDDGTGSVNGWNALKQRVSTAEGQIVTAQNDINAIETKNTEQDTAINGKISIAQGAANAGKALIVGPDGNVTPGDVSGGEVWEEIDLNNFPRDWVEGDQVIVYPYYYRFVPNVSSWSSAITVTSSGVDSNKICCGSRWIAKNNYQLEQIVATELSTAIIRYTTFRLNDLASLNHPSGDIGYLKANGFNGKGVETRSATVSASEIPTYIYKMYRLKK